MWKCPVCETEYGDVTVCPKCGFDGSCDYEHYPTPFAVAGAKSTRALRREWEQKQGPGLDQLLMEWMLLSTEEPSAAGAEMYLRRKADQGSREAQLWLGNAYRYGVGAKQDDVQAAQWYQKASDQQYALAHYMARQQARIANGHSFVWASVLRRDGGPRKTQRQQPFGLRWQQTAIIRQPKINWAIAVTRAKALHVTIHRRQRGSAGRRSRAMRRLSAIWGRAIKTAPACPRTRLRR